MPKIEPFERYPDRYDDWFERNRFAYESELLAIKAQLPKGGKGIEIGVGSGRFAAPLGIRVGVEPSSKMREIARRRGIEVVDGVAEDLPFEDSSFDYALMTTTLCFLDDVEAALKETHRITKPGGTIIIGFIDKNKPLGKLYQRRKDDNGFYGAATFYSVEEVAHHLKRAGFRSLRFTQTIFRDLSEITEVEPIKEGHGEGFFVVVRGRK